MDSAFDVRNQFQVHRGTTRMKEVRDEAKEILPHGMVGIPSFGYAHVRAR